METITNQSIFEELIGIVGQENAFTLDKDKYKYSHDETEDYSFMPDLVVKPLTAKEVSGILKICNEHLIPVTPRGGGTGLSGGALPTERGGARCYYGSISERSQREGLVLSSRSIK
jgi:glycolate oxidase